MCEHVGGRSLLGVRAVQCLGEGDDVPVERFHDVFVGARRERLADPLQIVLRRPEYDSRLLAPGDFVDILVADNVKNIVPASGTPVPASVNLDYLVVATLLQNVQVISVQRDFAEGAGVYEPATRAVPRKDAPSVQYVTLAVKPDDTQLLALAVDKAKLLTLSLRAFGDSEVPDLKPLPEWQLQRS